MFGYSGAKDVNLVKEFFNFVCTKESLQEILDNSPAYTNLDVTVEIDQHWLPAEKEFVDAIPTEKMAYSVLQTGTKYTNDYWMQFGSDMVDSTSSLSATGSRNLPKLVTVWCFRARYPSSQSVKEAAMNATSASACHTGSENCSRITTTGTSAMRVIVSRFGKFIKSLPKGHRPAHQ